VNTDNHTQVRPQLMCASTTRQLSVVQKMEADNINNTRIYYEDLYFVKMLVLMYFLNLGKWCIF